MIAVLVILALVLLCAFLLLGPDGVLDAFVQFMLGLFW